MLELLRQRREDVVAALLTVGLGLFIVLEAQGLRLGSLRSMGPGYFPMLLGAAMCILGVLLVVLSDPDQAPGWSQARIDRRGVLLIAAAFLSFTALIELVGLVLSIFTVVFLSALANRRNSLRVAAILAGGTAAACWVIFSLFLGLQIRAFW